METLAVHPAFNLAPGGISSGMSMATPFGGVAVSHKRRESGEIQVEPEGAPPVRPPHKVQRHSDMHDVREAFRGISLSRAGGVDLLMGAAEGGVEDEEGDEASSMSSMSSGSARTNRSDRTPFVDRDSDCEGSPRLPHAASKCQWSGSGEPSSFFDDDSAPPPEPLSPHCAAVDEGCVLQSLRSGRKVQVLEAALRMGQPPLTMPDPVLWKGGGGAGGGLASWKPHNHALIVYTPPKSIIGSSVQRAMMASSAVSKAQDAAAAARQMGQEVQQTLERRREMAAVRAGAGEMEMDRELPPGTSTDAHYAKWDQFAQGVDDDGDLRASVQSEGGGEDVDWQRLPEPGSQQQRAATHFNGAWMPASHAPPAAATWGAGGYAAAQRGSWAGGGSSGGAWGAQPMHPIFANGAPPFGGAAEEPGGMGRDSEMELDD